MTLQASNNVAVARSFPIQQEDSSSNTVYLVLLSNILSPEYNRTTISTVLSKYEVLDNEILYINSEKAISQKIDSEKENKKALFNLSSKNLQKFLEEEKKYGPIF